MTRGTSLRRLRPERFRRGPGGASVDALMLRIAALVAERQQLRVGEAHTTDLERNRLRIARAQWELAHALIDKHLPQRAAQSAA